jgi:2'-5' RNA ligase
MRVFDEFILDSKGNPERIWIECKVTESKELVDMQQAVGVKLKSFRPYPPEKFHLTLYHFGKPDIKYKILKENGIDISFNEYIETFINLLTEFKRAIPQLFELKVEGIGIYGSANHRVLGINLKNTKQLQATVESLYHRTNDFYRNLGVETPERFIAQTSRLINIYHPEKFKPHVSLGIIGLRSDAKVPALDNLLKKVELLPSRVVHFNE